MKKIFLATKGKRLLARFIDFMIMLVCSIIVYFAAVYPNVYDGARYASNSKRIIELYETSGLFMTSKDGHYSGKSNFTTYLTSFDRLYDVTLDLNGTYKEHNNLVKDLYIYYTTKNIDYDGSFNFNDETYRSQVLKLNTEESNIKEFTVDKEKSTYTMTFIDETKKDTVSLPFFLKAYENAAITVDSYHVIKELKDDSTNMMVSTLVLIIPVVVGFSFVLDGLVPFFAPHGQTIGKFIFHLIILTDKGHRANKFIILLRWLIYIIELAFGIATFGGGLLLPYTMFLFTKRRQALHDKIAHTIVADGRTSIYFESQAEESYFINRMKQKGIDLDAPVEKVNLFEGFDEPGNNEVIDNKETNNNEIIDNEEGVKDDE